MWKLRRGVYGVGDILKLIRILWLMVVFADSMPGNLRCYSRPSSFYISYSYGRHFCHGLSSLEILD